MLRKRLFLASTALVGFNGASNASDGEPCAYIATLQAQGTENYFPGQVAYDCVNSVPVDKEGDKKLIEELKVAWQWHSDLTWLKNPPEDWENGPLDMIAELDKIKDNLDDYESEYQVQMAINKITLWSGDYHLNWSPDILSVFNWDRGVSIVALSEHGVDLPKIYVDMDALRVAAGNVSESEISHIAKINGDDAWTYLEDLAQWQQYRDMDGRLNNLWANGETSSIGGFTSPFDFHGAKTILTFANGTLYEYTNQAWTVQNFTDVKDGKSFEKFCDAGIKKREPKGKLGGEVTIPKTNVHQGYLNKRDVIIPSSFPDAVVAADSNAVGGYFLKGDGYENVAVLKVITLSPEGDDSDIEFQSTISRFLKACKEENKTHLILDLRHNRGGYIRLMLDMFLQLSPHGKLWHGLRLRETPYFKVIGDVVNEIASNETITNYLRETWNEKITQDYSYWDYRQLMDAQGEKFESWEQLKGPERFNDDQYTATLRYILADEFFFHWQSRISFTNTTGLSTPFNHTNIIMFTNALCGSACASIAEELKNNAGVKSTTVGGAATEGSIQAVSGTKGGQVADITEMIFLATHIRNISLSFDLKSYPASETTLDKFVDTPQLLKRAGNNMTRLSLISMERKGDKTGTPLQYIYEAADCRIFYTLETFLTPEMAWKQAWDAFLEPETNCVKNSTGHKSSISGGFVPYGPWYLKTEDLPVPQGQEANKTSEKPASTSQNAASAGKETKDLGSAGSRVSASMVALFVSVAAMVVQL